MGWSRGGSTVAVSGVSAHSDVYCMCSRYCRPKSRGALGEGSEPMAPRRRQLRRNVSREALPVEVASVKCIRGGRRKRWMVLDTITHMGHECVCVSGRHPWLHMLLAGQVHRSPFHAAINNFVRDCRAASCRQWRGNSSEAKIPRLPTVVCLIRPIQRPAMAIYA